MDRLIIIDLLNDLIQLDVDAVEAYSHAIKHVEYHDIKKRLLDYQDDHQNHIRDLTAMVQALDGRPIKPTPDLKGYLIEGFTLLRSLTGTKGALEAMFTNEKLTNKRYGEAAAQDLPEEVMKWVKTNLTQEIRHLGYLEDVLTIPRHEL
jgi:rubrerythrin